VAAIGSSAWQVGVKYLMIAKAQTSRKDSPGSGLLFFTASIAVAIR